MITLFLKNTMKSKTLIEKQLKRKTNSELVETIIACKKNEGWNKVAEIISGPRRNRIDVNLDELNDVDDKSKIVVVPGKVLSRGEINKKIKVVALSFSENGKVKLLKSGCEVLSILEEIKLNPSAKGVVIFGKK